MMISTTMNMIHLHFIWLKILFLISSLLLGQEEDSISFDLDALWEEVVWEEITEITDVYYEVEQITPVAGVRGSEAEDEALTFLYYRRSMKGLSLLEVQRAYGKLIIKRDEYLKEGKSTEVIEQYILYLRNKLKNT